ncbi:MAG: hypothetical protein JWN95_3780 [Frankiales bacterium]|nr:hypothetical protein [Frankiales bacterium]
MNSELISPVTDDLSTDDETPDELTDEDDRPELDGLIDPADRDARAAAPSSDIAAGALHSARGIAAGGGGATSRNAAARVRRARRRSNGTVSYSGARPDDRDPQPIGRIVRGALPDLGWVGPLAEARLMSQWESVVGGHIAARCRPIQLTEGDLKISAESTAWATQLRLMAPQILARISAELPAGLVRRLTITGPTAPNWKHGPWSSRGRGVRDTYG